MPASGPGYTRNGSMTLGARGDSVTRLQQQLEADGLVGRNTTAVLAFQQARQLEADGLVGRNTTARLRETPAGFDDRPVTPTTSTSVMSAAELRRTDNTRVDRQMPDRGPGFMGYYSASKRWGTERTVETLRTVAANYHAATGQTLRIGDISLRGGGNIDGHASHETGRNVDIDMAFSDGRTNIESNRNSTNATWRSPAYDRAATRRLIQEIRRANPNVQILFNDPVLVREGLVRAYPNHDNHLHLQNMN